MQELYDTRGISLYYNAPRTSNLHPQMIIPPLRIGSLQDIALKEKPPDTTHGLYSSLEHLIHREPASNDTPSIYIIDNHQHAFFCWCEALKEGRIDAKALLAHFDMHDDTYTSSDYEVNVNDLSHVTDYVGSTLQCYNFIAPAYHHGVIGEIVTCSPFHQVPHDVKAISSFYDQIRISSLYSDGFDRILQGERKNLIVDIDLDYFLPFVDLKQFNDSFMVLDPDDFTPERLDFEIQQMKILLQRAGAVTLATSPGFIDQEQAVTLIHRLLDN
ncbi:UPF0489 family protein [Candidatus Roizmanbacteria bacterium]|nr:UPF0489 family protein [Candidatus Roizmanbacteria bacterium]